MQLTSQNFIALIAALVPVITSLSAFLYQSLVAKLPANKQALLTALAIQAVHMAEQVGGTGDGATKKRMAEDALNRALATMGVKVDPSLVNAAIEAIVYSLNQQAPRLVIRPVDTSSNAG